MPQHYDEEVKKKIVRLRIGTESPSTALLTNTEYQSPASLNGAEIFSMNAWIPKKPRRI